MSSPGPKSLVPQTPRPSPNTVKPSSKVKSVARGLGLTLKSYEPPPHLKLSEGLSGSTWFREKPQVPQKSVRKVFQVKVDSKGKNTWSSTMFK